MNRRGSSVMTTKNDINDSLLELNDTLKEILELLRLIHVNQIVQPKHPQPPVWPNPNVPNPWPYTPTPWPYTPPTNTCPKCGMDFSNMTGYVCTQFDCPVFPQITC